MPTQASARHRYSASLLTLVLVTGACSSSPTASVPHPPPATSADISIVDGASTMGAAAFSPDPKSLSLGTGTTATVRFVNMDGAGGGVYGGNTAVTHHVVSDDGTSFDTGDLGGYATASAHLAVGTYAFHCTIHPSMVGSVVVTP